VVTEVGFDASIGTRRVSFSDPNYASREYKEESGSLGVSYNPSGILSVGTGLSAARTRYQAPAFGQTSPDQSERRDIYFTAKWVPTGASTVSARVNVGKTEYELDTASDFSGVTGYLTWDWKPTGLLCLSTTVSRDTGQETGFLRLTDASTVTGTDFSRVTNALAVRAAYELTGKISVSGALSYANRDLVNGVTGETGQEKITNLSLGATTRATISVPGSIGPPSSACLATSPYTPTSSWPTSSSTASCPRPLPTPSSRRTSWPACGWVWAPRWVSTPPSARGGFRFPTPTSRHASTRKIEVAWVSATARAAS
jgi:hypothetical protein